MSPIMRNLLIGCAVAAVIVGGAYALLHRAPALNGSSSTAIATSSSATTSTSGVKGTGSYNVEVVNATPPSLDGPILITASSSLSAENQTLIRNILEQEIAMLRKEPTRVDLWLQLGVNRKVAGDYKGAIDAWEYVAQAAPKTLAAAALGDLGDLYMYFLKDYSKADTRYNQAISIDSHVVEYYRALFYLYRDVYKDKAKAQAILTLGLKNNPNSQDLLNLQSELK